MLPSADARGLPWIVGLSCFYAARALATAGIEFYTLSHELVAVEALDLVDEGDHPASLDSTRDHRRREGGGLQGRRG